MTKILALLLILSFPLITLASPPFEALERENEVQQRVMERSEQIRETIREEKRRIDSISQRPQEERREEAQQQRLYVIENSQEEKAELFKRIDDLREGAQENRLRISGELNQRLGEAMRNRAEQMAKNINMINFRFSESYFNMLDRTEDLITRLEERTERLENLLEIDLSKVYEKLLEARSEISGAREVITLQAEMEYEVYSESMEELGNSFREEMKKMRNDHRELRDTFIVPIRQTIRDSHLILRDTILEERRGNNN